jgi:hypothetical protein
MASSTKEPALNWLLKSEDASIRFLALTEVLGLPPDSHEVEETRRQILRGERVRTLLFGQQGDGGFGVHPYQKWTGAHWRLVSLVELAIPESDRKAIKAANQVLEWLRGESHLRAIKKINGLTRRCASQEGNALGVCSYLGMAEDTRVRALAESLIDWQWPDGGWNCDKRPEAHHSSVNESLSTMWGLAQYLKATNDADVKRAIERAAEFFLRHRLFRSHRSGRILDPKILKLRYPPYWHYDILQALRVLSFVDKLKDPRTREALDIVESKRSADGLWATEGCYWNMRRKVPVKGKGLLVSNVEVVDWGRHGPSEMITLNAMRVLKAAGRIK